MLYLSFNNVVRNTIPEPKHLKAVIECAGGTMVEKEETMNSQSSSEELDTSQLIVISCLTDKSYCDKFSGISDAQFVSAQFIIDSVCNQELAEVVDPFSTEEKPKPKHKEREPSPELFLENEEDDD
jgi:hypothetical protein